MMTVTTRPDQRRHVGMATFLLGLGVLLGSAPLGAVSRRASDAPDADVVHTVTETLPPVDAEDRGSILTHGTGTAPVLSATELDILVDARAAVSLAEARNAGSVTDDARLDSPANVERQKLERLAAAPAPSLETVRTFPDAEEKSP